MRKDYCKKCNHEEICNMPFKEEEECKSFESKNDRRTRGGYYD